ADLESDLKAILRDKYLAKADVGIAVARLGETPATATAPSSATVAAASESGDDPSIIYRFDSDIPLIPASNLKLLTTSAFLDHFGGDFKFHTPLLMKDGDLYLIGDGDPTLGDAELLKKLGWESDTAFRAWADELKKRGITSVRNVYVD